MIPAGLDERTIVAAALDIIAERGVKYGRVVMIPQEAGNKKAAGRKRDHRHS